MLYYLYAIIEKFQFWEYRGIAMRPRPQWGQGGRKGGNHTLKRGFLQSQNIYYLYRKTKWNKGEK
jgi:hypothetical protein